MEEEAAAAAAAASGETAVVQNAEPEHDNDELELEKLEKNDPEMLRICNTIVDQLESFKVRSFVSQQTNSCSSVPFCFLFSLFVCCY